MESVYTRVNQGHILSAGFGVILIGFAGFSILLSSTGLPLVAKDIAQQMGWYESFVGTLLVALATSLPELVVTIAALHLGAVDMAIANLLGSNLFNIFVLAVDDLLYTEGPLLADVSWVHAISAVSAVMMTGVAIVALLYRAQMRVLRTVGWASIILNLFYQRVCDLPARRIAPT